MQILVGYLKSAEGRAALEYAISETRLRRGKLWIVHSMRGGTRDEAEQAVLYRKELEQVERRLIAEQIDFEIKEFVQGQSPSEDLVQFANENDVDLIVIGIRRRSPVGKLVLGSNAQDILLRADCPVLAVKAP